MECSMPGSCPLLSRRVCSNSGSLKQRCHLTISSPVTPFFFCLQSFPASTSFPIESALGIRWPKYWSFSLSNCSSYEYLSWIWASLVAQRLKNLPGMRETWVRSLSREDPLEKEMATHSSILAWGIPWMEEPGGLQSMGLQRVGHHWGTSLSQSFLHCLLTLSTWAYL